MQLTTPPISPASNAPNKSDLENAGLLAGYTFFLCLVGFVVGGVFTGFDRLPSIIAGAGITSGLAFFGKLLVLR